MIAKWLYDGKAGRALMGEVVTETVGFGNKVLLEIKVTSCESKQDNGKIGKMYLVSRSKCQLGY